MASKITLTVATFSSVYTVTGKTDVEVGDILDWLTADKRDPMPDGLTATQQKQWLLDQAMAEIVRYIKQEAAKNRRRMLAAQQASIDAQAESDTAL